MKTETVCIIPARGGSKRIPNKNLKDFKGKPIICYSIEAALNSNLFDDVIVSTDSEEIRAIALEYGASVPFLRSERNSGDHSTTYDVILEVTEKLKDEGRSYPFTCCLYPTAPFVTGEKLIEAQKMLKDCEGVLSVSEYSYPIQRSLVIRSGSVKMKWEEHLKSRSQDLESHYHDAGQFYFFDTEEYIRSRSVFKLNTKALILSQLEVQDIDTPEDWKLAELKFEMLQKRS